MSIRPGDDIDPANSDASACKFVDTIIVPRARDLGGFEVRRALPAVERRMIGPFVFLDQMGPADFEVGKGIDVRPHPHINLATVTYLYAGEIYHRDTLGSSQAIQPGDLNWMSAGRGIAHSERTAPELRASGHPLFGFRRKVALPERRRERPDLRSLSESAAADAGWRRQDVRVIAGSLFGKSSPAKLKSPLFYADARLDAGASLPRSRVRRARALHCRWRDRDRGRSF